jgi:hypothetical protein
MTARIFVALCIAALAWPLWADGVAPIEIEPPSPHLKGPDSRQQLLVTVSPEGRPRDATDRADFVSSNPAVARVTEAGTVFPVADGEATIVATVDGQAAEVRVRVEGAALEPAVDFARDVIPILTKAGCNAGGCHGKQNGQNGFKLSVFGYDPAADYEALTQQGRGRRLFPAAPERSLLLAKATNRVPHRGGCRLAEDSPEYALLLRWIREGMSPARADTPRVVALELMPGELVLDAESTQRLLVTARFSDGSTRDVTHAAVYSSNDQSLAAVDEAGRITTGGLPGETALVVRYQDQVAACFVAVPFNRRSADAVSLEQWDRTHFIDRLLAEKWQRLNLSPSPPADDATFHRRLHLDVIGRLPTPAETTAFLADDSDDKRLRLVDRLLDLPEYADFWSLRWADLLRIHGEELGHRSAHRYHQWVRDAIARNRPYDEFVRDLLTARGAEDAHPAANFYRTFTTPEDLTVAVSQLFLGVRLECARCHHHPYERWSQDDFYGLAAFFPRVQKKAPAGGAATVFIAATGDVTHPQTGAKLRPRVPLGQPLDVPPEADPRVALAAWAAEPGNPFVARALVNRFWAHLMGRGLVEPVDDLRGTNPATNEPLLAALAEDFVAHGCDVRHLIRTIVTSRAYGLSSLPGPDNVRDNQNFSRAYRKQIAAEVLFDAVCDATGEREDFPHVPPGTRAVQLWDHQLPSRFLDTFGRPLRKSVCACERLDETTLGQVLHLMNSPAVDDKITSPTGRIGRLVAAGTPSPEIVSELYLAALGRPPRDGERAAALAAFAAADATPRDAAEDILWSLLNSAEFVLNH